MKEAEKHVSEHNLFGYIKKARSRLIILPKRKCTGFVVDHGELLSELVSWASSSSATRAHKVLQPRNSCYLESQTRDERNSPVLRKQSLIWATVRQIDSNVPMLAQFSVTGSLLNEIPGIQLKETPSSITFQKMNVEEISTNYKWPQSTMDNTTIVVVVEFILGYWEEKRAGGVSRIFFRSSLEEIWREGKLAGKRSVESENWSISVK